MSWLDIIKLVVPAIIAKKVPHGEQIAPYVVMGIEQAEALRTSKSGEERLTHAVEIVNTAMDVHNSIVPADKQIDKSAVNGAIGNGITTAISIANLIHRD